MPSTLRRLLRSGRIENVCLIDKRRELQALNVSSKLNVVSAFGMRDIIALLLICLLNVVVKPVRSVASLKIDNGLVEPPRLECKFLYNLQFLFVLRPVRLYHCPRSNKTTVLWPCFCQRPITFARVFGARKWSKRRNTKSQIASFTF